MNIKKDPIVKIIINNVEDCFDLKFNQVNNRSRKRHLVIPRHVAYYFTCMFTKYSLSSIGSVFNNDHATVLHAKNSVNNMIFSDRDFRNLITNLKDKIELKVQNYKKSNQEYGTTKEAVFIKLLDSFISDPEEQKKWQDKYISAID